MSEGQLTTNQVVHTLAKDTKLNIHTAWTGLQLEQNFGELSGNAGIKVNKLRNEGKINPGNSPGILTIDGDLDLLELSELIIETAGTTAGIDYDVLKVTGDLQLGGILIFDFIDDFDLDALLLFQFLEVDGLISGAFQDIRIKGLAANTSYV